jgi:flagellar biosynthesis protein FlhB
MEENQTTKSSENTENLTPTSTSAPKNIFDGIAFWSKLIAVVFFVLAVLSLFTVVGALINGCVGYLFWKVGEYAAMLKNEDYPPILQPFFHAVRNLVRVIGVVFITLAITSVAFTLLVFTVFSGLLLASPKSDKQYMDKTYMEDKIQKGDRENFRNRLFDEKYEEEPTNTK